MEIKWRPTLINTVILVLTLFGVGQTQTTQPESQGKQLEERIKDLEQRLNYLEKKVAPGTLSRQEVAAEIEQRLAKLEGKYDKIYGPDSFRVYWQDGLTFETEDKSFRFKLGGRIQNDWAWFCDKDDAFGDLEDGTEFRRARLSLEGVIYDNVEFKGEYDFAGGDAQFKDVFIGLKHLPVIGNVRVGRFKEPFSLEEITSDNYSTFMERGLPNVFAPSYSTGGMIHNSAFDDRMTWAVGVFRGTDKFGNGSGDGDYSYTGRLTWLPWYADEGRKLVHVGLSYTHRSPNDKQVQFKQRPEAHLAPVFVDTDTFEANRVDSLGPELALVYGPFSIQSEYIQTWVDAINTSDPSFHGGYVQSSYFLTGESRPYKKSAGCFDRVRPKKNFAWKGERGPGAWELAGRYSWLDLDDAAVHGGMLQDFTLGLNWYLNPNTRVMWNYIHANAEDQGDADIFGMRLQIDF